MDLRIFIKGQIITPQFQTFETNPPNTSIKHATHRPSVPRHPRVQNFIRKSLRRLHPRRRTSNLRLKTGGVGARPRRRRSRLQKAPLLRHHRKVIRPRQTGYEGEAPTAVEDLSLEHPQIKFRMSFLKGYLVKLVTMDYDQASTWEYLDKVALMHTGVAGFAHRAKKPGLRVEYIHMALLLAYVIDVLLGAVIEHPDLDDKTKSAVLRAFNKVLWIQNDLFSRHYIPSEDSPSKSTKCAGLGSKAQGVLFGAATVVFAGVLQVLYQRARA
ncbi:uncharacterized protein LAJ45_04614 [Morchella importuna]|uniref:uncharacterized protein n=1 Tax=Morchella importuna TaxID=1174673 RepID=UPI001E8E1E4D|nr:uncharacterized protein LAJ45_04614 [Morchella importuna]KAH8151410.1 hypothetical protein LAJ45_04614 [Morchella importuna]